MSLTFNIPAPLCFLKETEGWNYLFAVAQTYTICACPVTLSGSNNITTSVQFKLAGHGPVTYFPHNTLCKIRDKAVCHQLNNLHHSIVSAKRRKTQKRKHSYVSQKGKCPLGLLLLLLKVKFNAVNGYSLHVNRQKRRDKYRE